MMHEQTDLVESRMILLEQFVDTAENGPYKVGPYRMGPTSQILIHTRTNREEYTIILDLQNAVFVFFGQGEDEHFWISLDNSLLSTISCYARDSIGIFSVSLS